MTPALHAHLFADCDRPACPRCSFARREHGPDARYPLLEDSFVFPAITRGSHTGLWFVTGCPHTLPLRDRSFATHRRGCWAWRGLAQRLNGNGRGGSKQVQ